LFDSGKVFYSIGELVMPNALVITKGMKFGRLTIVKEASRYISPRGERIRMFKCLCGCGNFITTRLLTLRSVKTISCGCYGKEQLRKVNKERSSISGRHHPIYGRHRAMRSRCYSINSTAFDYYGGRGIQVYHEWDFPGNEGFWNFVEWAEVWIKERGIKSFKGLEIDRIDNDGDYTPENCRWITRQEQMHNTRQNVFVTVKGETLIAEDALRKYGIKGLKSATFRSRLALGWKAEKALSTPSRALKKKNF